MALTRMLLLKCFSGPYALCKYKSTYTYTVQCVCNFLHLWFSQSLPSYFVHTVYLSSCLHCWMFSMLQSLLMELKVPPHLYQNHQHHLCHHSLLLCKSVFLFVTSSFHCHHSVHYICTHLPSIQTSSIQRNFPLSLWHKTDWGWLVLSWLLRFSTGHSAAGVGGGVGSNSGARSTQAQETGGSIPAKPAGWWPDCCGCTSVYVRILYLSACTTLIWAIFQCFQKVENYITYYPLLK